MPHAPDHAAPAPGEAIARSPLPAPRTSLVGRDDDVAAVRARLAADGTRLLTLTGVGGSGKTRLALEASRALADAFPGGVTFVALADAPDEAAMALATARALRVPLVDGTPVRDAILAHLAREDDGPALLVLDNLEHLADAAPTLGALLDGCARLRMLVTSRVPLRIYGESEFPVAPLAVPGEDAVTAGAVGAFPSVELFVQRAAAAHPGFALDDDNAAAIATVCRKLDGLPLAIELVAAHAGGRAPATILSGVASHLDLPARNVRDVPDRHRSLRNAIDWSHDALPPAARELFRRVSVFAGGFTLEAARAVHAIDGMPEVGDAVADALGHLVEASLVQVDAASGEDRYSMLETVRDYAREQLAAKRETAQARRALAAYCLVLAEEGNPRLPVAAREAWLGRCDHERANFQVALEAMLEHGWHDMALRLGSALNGYWERREALVEGHRMLDAILRRVPPDVDREAWANIAYCKGGLSDVLGLHAEASEDYEAMLRLEREAGNAKGKSIALNALAFSSIFRSRYDEALAHMRAAQAIWDGFGDRTARAAGLGNLAIVHLVRGEHDAARACLEDAIECFESANDKASVAWCLSSLGDLERDCRDFAAAEANYQRACMLFVGQADYWGLARTWGDMGHVALARGRHDVAAGLFRDALVLFGKLDYRRGVATTIEGCARLAVARGDPALAMRLAGAAEAVRRSVHVVVMPYIRDQVAAELAPAREALGEAEADGLWRRGAAMPVAEAIAAAAGSVSASR
jgi:predicted ATPase